MNRGNIRGSRYSKPPVEDLRLKLNRIRERDHSNSEGGFSNDHPGNLLRDPARDGSYQERRGNFGYNRGRGDFRNKESYGHSRGRGRGNLNHDNPIFFSQNRGRGNRYNNENYGSERPSRGQGYNKPSIGQTEWNKGIPINIHVEVKTDSGLRSCNINDVGTFSNNITPRRGNFANRRSRGRSFRGRDKSAIATNTNNDSNEVSTKGETEKILGEEDVSAKKGDNENSYCLEAHGEFMNDLNEEYKDSKNEENVQVQLQEGFNQDDVGSEEIAEVINSVEDYTLGNDSVKNNNSIEVDNEENKVQMLEEELKKIVITKPNNLMVENFEKGTELDV